MIRQHKIAIVGAGLVGGSAALFAAYSIPGAEIVLIDVEPVRAEGQVLDLAHAAAIWRSADFRAGDYQDARGARLPDAICDRIGAGHVRCWLCDAGRMVEGWVHCERRLPRDLALYRTALVDVACIRLGSIWSGRPRDGAETLRLPRLYESLQFPGPDLSDGTQCLPGWNSF